MVQYRVYVLSLDCVRHNTSYRGGGLARCRVASGLTPVLAPGRPALYYSPNIGGRGNLSHSLPHLRVECALETDCERGGAHTAYRSRKVTYTDKTQIHTLPFFRFYRFTRILQEKKENTVVTVSKYAEYKRIILPFFVRKKFGR